MLLIRRLVIFKKRACSTNQTYKLKKKCLVTEIRLIANPNTGHLNQHIITLEKTRNNAENVNAFLYLYWLRTAKNSKYLDQKVTFYYFVLHPEYHSV